MDNKEATKYFYDMMQNASHYVSLVTVAKADGELTEKETRYLTTLAKKWNIDNKNTQMVLKIGVLTPGSYAPYALKGKIEHILELVLMMSCDGRSDDRAMKVCKDVAYKYGLKDTIVKYILDKLHDMMDRKVRLKSNDFDSLLNYFYKKLKDDYSGDKDKYDMANRVMFKKPFH